MTSPQIAELTARINRLQHMMAEFPAAEIVVSSANRDVVVAVDAHGRLVALQLAHGATERFTCGALELLINDTLRTAAANALDAAASPALSA